MQAVFPTIEGPDTDARFAVDLEEVRDLPSGEEREQVGQIVRECVATLATTFYDTMLRDPLAAPMLSNALVDKRLHAAMQGWLEHLFDPAVAADVLQETQRRTGEIHARVGVPLSLVSRSARVLRRAIASALAEAGFDADALLRMTRYVDELLILAVEEMAMSSALNTNRLARSQEAYRLFFLGQDMRAERERRRSELLEWAQQILDRYYWAVGEETSYGEGPTSFALWLQHKAAVLFADAPEVDQIRADMQRMERELLPRLSQARANHADARSVMGEIRHCIDGIKVTLGALFDRYVAVEDGRDSITALLNRRYFPVIARREIDLAGAQGSSFAVLMFDLDRFRETVAPFGSETGNLLLHQVATALQEHLRSGDFLFRLGDDEFLALLPECDAASALRAADGLRQRIEALKPDAGGAEQLLLTTSIGIACFDGHPDYQRLLDRADAALRDAKHDGRNCCRMAD